MSSTEPLDKDEKIKTLRARVAEREQEIRELRARVAELQAQRNDLLARMSTLKKLIGQLDRAIG